MTVSPATMLSPILMTDWLRIVLELTIKLWGRISSCPTTLIVRPDLKHPVWRPAQNWRIAHRQGDAWSGFDFNLVAIFIARS